MGYTITIGELQIDKSPDDGLECCCLRFDAKTVNHPNAPAYGEPTDYMNTRWPSYSVWSDFMKAAGLYSVFFTERGHLIGDHPGVRLVTKELVDRIGVALADFKLRNPEAKPVMAEGDINSSWLCRLIWLDYWLRWAIENCETPVIANS